MAAETWMDGKTACEMKFADECSDALDLAAVAKFDVSGYAKAPESVKAVVDSPPPAQTPTEPPKLMDLLNIQIGKELSGALRYFAMATVFHARGLEGFAARMMEQANGEIEHATKVLRYLIDTGSAIAIPPVAAPDIDPKATPAALAARALDMEKAITTDWKAIAATATDPASVALSHEFATMQVAEETEAATLSARVNLAGGEGAGVLIVDAELKGMFLKAEAAARERGAAVETDGVEERVEAEKRPDGEDQVRFHLLHVEYIYIYIYIYIHIYIYI
jgi:ferritin